MSEANVSTKKEQTFKEGSVGIDAEGKLSVRPLVAPQRHIYSISHEETKMLRTSLSTKVPRVRKVRFSSSKAERGPAFLICYAARVTTRPPNAMRLARNINK